LDTDKNERIGMTEPGRLGSLFKKLYNGLPWIEVNIVDVLNKLSANEAQARLIDNCNTIWEITNHLISWRLNVLQRVEGKIINTPDHNYFQRVEDISDEAWRDTLYRLGESQEAWLQFINKCNSRDLDKIYPVNNMTYYEHIQGIIHHDAYHLGQIVILAKQIKH
jgi:uncharacterized damage-inducible protein DinB